MATINYDGKGEHEAIMSAHTLVIYEQEFKSGLIEDVYGRIVVPETEKSGLVVADYTIDNWLAYIKALWAMLKTASDLAKARGLKAEEVASFDEWSMDAVEIDLSQVSSFVLTQCQKGLFRAGAAASEGKPA